MVLRQLLQRQQVVLPLAKSSRQLRTVAAGSGHHRTPLEVTGQQSPVRLVVLARTTVARFALVLPVPASMGVRRLLVAKLVVALKPVHHQRRVVLLQARPIR